VDAAGERRLAGQADVAQRVEVVPAAGLVAKPVAPVSAAIPVIAVATVAEVPPKVPSSRLLWPNFVVLLMLSISPASWSNSAWAAATAPASWEPELFAWTASTFMRCRIESTSVRAPSAVCTTLMPSCAFLTAWDRPPICACRPWLMLRPAASSAALLMR